MRRSCILLTIVIACAGTHAPGQDAGTIDPTPVPRLEPPSHEARLVYEGQLVWLGAPVDGDVDFLLWAFDRPVAGTLIDGPAAYDLVPVREGWFRLELPPTLLSHGVGFVWLEVAVRWPSGQGEYALLDGRQRFDTSSVAFVRRETADTDSQDKSRDAREPQPTHHLGPSRPAVPVALARPGESNTSTGSARHGGERSTEHLADRGGSGSDGGGRACDWTISGNTIYYLCGNVGIGTPNPLRPLHVVTLGPVAILAESTNIAADQFYYGIWGQTASPNGRGVLGVATATSGSTYGVFGRSDSSSGRGVYGLASAPAGTTTGVYGESMSQNGRGVFGIARKTSGTNYGVWGESASTTGRGVLGYATATTGGAYGVFGRSDSTSGRGVYGIATRTTGVAHGVVGQTNSGQGAGVYGFSTSTSGATGVLGKVGDAGAAYGVYGIAEGTHGTAVFGHSTVLSGLAYGVAGRADSTAGIALSGHASASTGATMGVLAICTSTSSGARGLYAVASAPAVAIYAEGNSVTTGTKSFEIDHPLDPANKFLRHYCTEGPEPVNAYTGNVILDDSGQAWVDLPDYFEAINRDFRYQLTPIGAPAPMLYVADEVRDNRVRIAGGPPGLKVSWRIDATRNDAYLRAYGAPTEIDKTPELQGRYLHPELLGLPADTGIHHATKSFTSRLPSP
ncbi:MAG: hypothetical protein AMXMBFR77_28180 [Phycisphaerales bacterium]